MKIRITAVTIITVATQDEAEELLELFREDEEELLDQLMAAESIVTSASLVDDDSSECPICGEPMEARHLLCPSCWEEPQNDNNQ